MASEEAKQKTQLVEEVRQMLISKEELDQMTFKERWRYLVKGGNAGKLRKFLDYNEDNPHIYAALKKMAKEFYDEGWRRGAVWWFFQPIRYGPGTTVDKATAYKISNDYFAYYARLLIARNTNYAGWIVVKRLKGQSPYPE